jgi:O-6-methylguanine DNA methyltransferase
MPPTPTSIAILTLAGPDGPFLVAATERGVAAAEWRASEEAFLAGLRRRLGAIEIETDGPAMDRLRAARPTIEALLAGQPVDGGAIDIDLRDRPLFDRRVLDAVRGLRWGETASYGSIARAVGAPRASRAVGGALGRNPISLVIPCHRVIASDGTLGGYGGGDPGDRAKHLARKQALLRREGITVARREG